MGRLAVEMEVDRVTIEVPDTKSIRFRWPSDHNPDFKTGQFITVYWPDAPEYKRAYSLSSCALDHGFYEVTVKRDGKMGTRLVDWIKPGDRLMVLPPTGRFLPVLEPNLQLLCIAGGSGVTPFRAFAREATLRNLETRITVLYSVRTTNDIIFRDEFHQLALDNPRFNFKVTCTRLHPDDPWTGRRGRLTTDWVLEHVHDPTQTIFYACGSNDFVEFTEKLVLHELHADKSRMRTEKWG
jgi:glycine betaine catabolism B